MLGLYDPLNNDAPPAQGYTKRCEYDGSNNLIYEGWALASRGDDGSGAVWAIRKNTYDGSNNLTLSQWADGNSREDNVWNNRATLNYQ